MLSYQEGHVELFVSWVPSGNAFDFVCFEGVMANADGGSLISFGKGFLNGHYTFEGLGVFSPIDTDLFSKNNAPV